MKRLLASLRLPQTPRPRGVTFLALGVLSIAGLNLLRCLQALNDWAFLSRQLWVSPLYLALTGLIWAGAGLPLFFGLWWGKAWSSVWLQGTALVYSLYFWLERLFLFGRPVTMPLYQPRLPGNWPFLCVTNLLILGLIFWLLERPKTRAYWQGSKPKSEEETNE